MSKTSIEFALQTNHNRSSQEIEREENFFNTMFKILGEIVPYELDTTQKIIYTNTDQYGYRFAVSSPLSIQELVIVLRKYSIDTVAKEDCLNGIPPCTVCILHAN